VISIARGFAPSLSRRDGLRFLLLLNTASGGEENAGNATQRATVRRHPGCSAHNRLLPRSASGGGCALSVPTVRVPLKKRVQEIVVTVTPAQAEVTVRESPARASDDSQIAEMPAPRRAPPLAGASPTLAERSKRTAIFQEGPMARMCRTRTALTGLHSAPFRSGG